MQGTLEAPWYGDRGGGGVVDAQLFDRTDTLRATGKDAAAEAGSDPVGLAAESWDPDGVRRLFAARGSGMLGPVAASAVVLAGTSPGTHYAGAGVDLHAGTRTLALGAHVALTEDDAVTNASLDDGSVAEIVLDASGRGPNALLVRARWRDERGVLGDDESQHQDAALVIGALARQRRARHGGGRARVRRRARLRRARDDVGARRAAVVRVGRAARLGLDACTRVRAPRRWARRDTRSRAARSASSR